MSTNSVVTDECPADLETLQRFWRNTTERIAKERAYAATRSDSDWWKGYGAALYWINTEAFNANQGDEDESAG